MPTQPTTNCPSQEVGKAPPLGGPGGAEGPLLAACEAQIQRYKALQEEILVCGGLNQCTATSA